MLRSSLASPHHASPPLLARYRIRLGASLDGDTRLPGKYFARHLLPRESERCPCNFGLNLNPQIAGWSDYWNTNGHGNYNAMLAELKHQFATQFMADAQFTWAKSMDTSSGPYFEQTYPYDLNLTTDAPTTTSANRSNFMESGSRSSSMAARVGWIRLWAAGRSALSSTFTLDFLGPRSLVWSVEVSIAELAVMGSFIREHIWVARARSTSNDAFKTAAASNFPNGGPAYFSTPAYTAYGARLRRALMEPLFLNHLA